MLTYLAAPIDQTGAEGAEDTRKLRAAAIKELNWGESGVYDPSRAFHHAMNDPRQAYAVNEAALAQADAVLAVWPPHVMSVGTPMEILTAYNAGKPVVVVGPTSSMQLLGMGIPVFPVEALPDAVRCLVGLVTGESPMKCGEDRSEPLFYVGDQALEPVRGHDGDAAFDMFVSESTVIPGHGFVDVPLGIRIELPRGTWGLLTGRSSTVRSRGLLVTQGVIDNGYRGEMFAGCWNLEPEPHTVRRGERIAQVIVLPLSTCSVERVETLSDTDRGEGGFGSTGT